MNLELNEELELNSLEEIEENLDVEQAKGLMLA